MTSSPTSDTDPAGPEATAPPQAPMAPIGRLFAAVAFLEAFTWVGLLVGMFLKYVTGTTEAGVWLFGRLHGGTFMVYVGVTIVAAISLRWRWWVTLIALLAAVPLVTVPMDLRAGPGAHALRACSRRATGAGPAQALRRPMRRPGSRRAGRERLTARRADWRGRLKGRPEASRRRPRVRRREPAPQWARPDRPVSTPCEVLRTRAHAQIGPWPERSQRSAPSPRGAAAYRDW